LKDPDKKREGYLRTFNAEVEAAFYERNSRARLRFCLIDWRRICADVGADTESSSVSALINHLMLDWAVIPPASLHSIHISMCAHNLCTYRWASVSTFHRIFRSSLHTNKILKFLSFPLFFFNFHLGVFHRIF
uniref:AAA_lid_7 domain-containing protein n=1 Tax=Ascaris lumbricoides TaxID=6252 RepID=A0A0M3IFQ9_ASCLU